MNLTVTCLVLALLSIAINYLRRRFGTYTLEKQDAAFPLVDLFKLNLAREQEAFNISYQRWRDDGGSSSVGEKIHDFLTFHKMTSNIFTANEMCRRLYEAEKGVHGGSAQKTDLFFYDAIGSNEVADFLYSHVDGGCMVSLKMALQKLDCVANVECVEQALIMKRAVIAAKYALKCVLHYVDVVKDVLILLKLWDYITDSDGNILRTDYHTFPITVTGVLSASILLAEASNALVIASHSAFERFSIKGRPGLMLLAPAMPAVTLFQEMITEMAEAECVKSIKRCSRDGTPWEQSGHFDARDNSHMAMGDARKDFQFLPPPP